MFFFGKNKNENMHEEEPYNKNAKYKILGTGCDKCTKLYNNLKQLQDEGEIEGEITKVADVQTIAAYGVMSTPALVVDEKIIFSGESPSKNKLKDMISSI